MGKKKGRKQKPSEKLKEPEGGEIIEETDEETSCSSTSTTPEKENTASQKPTSEATNKADNLAIGSVASSQQAAADIDSVATSQQAAADSKGNNEDTPTAAEHQMTDTIVD